MGLFGRKTAEKLDTAADGLIRAGERVGGVKGAKIGNAVAGIILGRRLERCSEACGWCNGHPDS
ncbi:hypothetical protein [Streptomyces sp. NRRL F-5135]|uniref:hypothetical protein n=1 Tax=Streptomyces sp. NRRL F-5135 TaxID=1463858 RepID=UPI0004C87D41|nr:hypothetical protein [Streptomyces sp. NRRL F-5135]